MSMSVLDNDRQCQRWSEISQHELGFELANKVIEVDTESSNKVTVQHSCGYGDSSRHLCRLAHRTMMSEHTLCVDFGSPYVFCKCSLMFDDVGGMPI
ncbi:hypothetical protein PPL_04966 [Heterostelium album PN500]|uniref:Uncharacterized protein n=1 Tax=Heterostelium pallidum (strain ATCC 26659 / Pp 5 / PN500) TaxID=670386 RepID=D3B922_HETP5|nr:hypothetical protein PPL_04966 [Heterostelium album PN500]EFA82061.1 hypothetical protein PPL_04966 [Heterostelium album PN500]|eukprot:XP_020434178.1 hypothetical protein PPL_04966 [Heterostelium album PN500]